MPVSKTTRRGNGAGWGGPASGVGSNSKTRTPGPGRPAGLRTGEGKAAVAREAVLDLLPEAVRRVASVLMDDEDPRNLQAAFGLMDRGGLNPKQTVEADITTREEPMTPEQRRARIAELVAKLGGAGGAD